MASEESNAGAAGTTPAAAQPVPTADAASGQQQRSSDDAQGRGKWRGGNKRGGHKGHGSAKHESGGWQRDNRPKKRARFEGGDRRDRAGGDKYADRPSNMRIPFSAEEIAAESRRPKRKVAVMIGYAGTGYHGMQINHDDKTIEGDLFAAFVAAGAIAKANADDPKKSSLVRCARTDKGVHAAGNVISLKLIVEDADVVARINAHLPPQIRIWGIERTINSFSCYQACDSRWYEYLLPSYALLPPHPDSFLGREMAQRAAAAAADVDTDMQRRLADVRDFWADVERDVVQPLLDALDPDLRKTVQAQLHATDEFRAAGHRNLGDLETGGTEEADNSDPTAPKPAVEKALREIKAAYVAAKRRYRVTPARLAQLQEALAQFEGTRNFHNYTVQKAFGDASAKRHIKSFFVNPEPIQIRDTQWLSLRVHGQSFMMHQIRKMVAMAVMLTRCGTAPAPAMDLSYGPRRISIPRAPGFGLLLERPVFDSYNGRAQTQFGKAPLDFDRYEAAMRAFKDKEIYGRIWDVEESQNGFHSFFHQLDNYRTSYYLWAVPGGFEAAFERFGHGQREPEPVLDEEGADVDDGQGEG